MVTVDGFFEGENHNIDWHNTDEEFQEFAIQQLENMDAILFGRVTYKMMANYWPSEDAILSDPIVSNFMNSAKKYVFSTTLQTADWNNSTLIKENVEEEVRKLKEMDGKEIGIFGSADLSASLIKMGLVDEIRIIVNPVLLGSGTPLFHGLKAHKNLKLNSSRVFKNGNVLLNYQFSI
jgi:dihydrofolate reductase